MTGCRRTWAAATGDPYRCILAEGHPSPHRSVNGQTHVDPADAWRHMAGMLGHLLERECDTRGVIPDDVSAALGWLERMEQRPPT